MLNRVRPGPSGDGRGLTHEIASTRSRAKRLVVVDEAGAVIFGVTGCLVLLSVALVVNLVYGMVLIYAFPIALAAWLFGRWIAAGVSGFAMLGTTAVAVMGHRGLDALPIALPALVLVAIVSIGASEWARRSESLVDLLDQRERRHRQMLETMAKVSHELVTSKRWEVIAAHSLRSLRHDLDLDMAWMYRRGVGGEGELTLLAQEGQPPPRRVVEVGEGSVGHVARTGRPLRLASAAALAAELPDLPPSALEAPIEARLVLPVFVKGAPSGVVLLGSRRRRAWSDEEAGVASAIVSNLGLAMENASAYRSTIEALVRMEEISQMKSDFLKTVSHELRTPLTVVTGYLDMMADGSLGKVPVEWLMPMRQLNSKVEELNRLVQMMLEASRAEGPTLNVNLEEVDVGQTVRHAVEAQQAEAERAGHRLELHLPAGPVHSLCDRDKLLVVLRNLLENAIKYSPGEARVEVGVVADERSVRIWVADRGLGIPEAEKEHVFQQFHRVDGPERAAIGGSGLGLFIVRQLVEVQGGSVSVEDRDGGGSVFSFELPRQASLLPGTGTVAAMGSRQRARRRHEVRATA